MGSVFLTNLPKPQCLPWTGWMKLKRCCFCCQQRFNFTCNSQYTAPILGRMFSMLACEMRSSKSSNCSDPTNSQDQHNNLVLAEASVWESAGKDVPGVLHVDTNEFRYICGSICIPAPLEDSINHLAMYQLGFLVSALGCNLSNLLGFTPRTIEMMMKRHKMEKRNSETTKRNPALVTMNRKFGMIHGLSSLANIMSFGSLAMPCAPGTSPAISTCEAVTGTEAFPML